jgi:hypothetical protein
MTLFHDSFTVATSATLIVEVPLKNPTVLVTIVNDDNNPIYIGDSAVATSGADKGLTVSKNTAYNIALNAGDKLYAVSAAGTASNSVSVLYSKVIG